MLDGEVLGSPAGGGSRTPPRGCSRAPPGGVEKGDPEESMGALYMISNETQILSFKLENGGGIGEYFSLSCYRYRRKLLHNN